MQKDLDEEFRTKVLTHGPVGIWRTASGWYMPYAPFSEQVISFYADGTGLIRQVGVGSLEDMRFHWFMSEPGLLHTQVQLDPGEEDDGCDWWEKLRLEFRREKKQFEELDILVSDPALLYGGRQSSFWSLLYPIGSIGPNQTDS